MKMKHSLIALAVAGATSAAVVTPAQAGDVTVYGIAQVELASVSYQTEASEITPGACDGTPSVADGCNGIDILDNSMGRVGVKASEDLGNGMKGLAKFEFKADTADNEASTGISLTARESMVGLKAGWGQVEAGRLKSAYKYAGGVKYDAFVATTLQARGNGGMSGKGKYGQSVSLGGLNAYGHNGFLKNQIGYQYGSKGGFSLRVTYGAADGMGDYSVNAMFKQDKWEVFVAAVDTGDVFNTGTNEAYSAVKAGGALKFGAHKFMLQYEATEFSEDGFESVKPTYIYAAWNMKMGKWKWVVNVGQIDVDDPTTPNSDTTYAALGGYYNFSKTTSTFFGYRMSDADDKSKEDVISIGLKKKF
ncbi:porin [Kaarinaea lacus]